MYEDFKSYLSCLMEHHRYSTLLAAGGILFAILVMLIGFFHTLFIVVCAGAGLYVGHMLDRGDDVREKIWNMLPDYLRYRRRKY